MLLPSTTTTAPVHHQRHSLRRLSFSTSLSYFLSPPSGFSISTLLKPPKSPKISCSSKWEADSYGTLDYEKRPKLHWYAIYKRISMMRSPEESSVAIVLTQCENDGKNISKMDLSRIIKKLRKFRLYKLALEAYEWMNERAERFNVTSSDTAIQLDLIAKVHGITNAEEYFLSLPGSLKDKRIYGSLLNAYVHSGMRVKAESVFDEMRNRDYATNALAYNVMMTLYMNLRDHDKLECMISEMMEKKILDIFSYNIWLSSRGYEGSLQVMEQAFEQMEMDASVDPNWTTFSIMASMYIKMGALGKAEDCLKKMECRITAWDRAPYHYLMSLYASVGNKEEVHRVWNVYKSKFSYIPNMGYHSVISSLVRLGDIKGAENMFDEWLSAKSRYDPRIANLLLSWYLRNELLDKGESFFSRMIDDGGNPNSMTWEMAAQLHIKRGRIPEALSCLKDAVSAEGSRIWRPRFATVSSVLQLCDQENDMESKEKIIEMLKQNGCFDHEDYMSYIATHNGLNTVKDTFHDNGDEVAEVLLDELHGSLQ